MTGTSSTPEGWGTEPPPFPPTEPVDPRTLRRSRSDRVVAGVLGGVGRRVGVDPVVLRVVIAVLSLFGGIGIMLYALGWLLLPEEGEDASLASAALAGSAERSSGTVVKAGALAAVTLIAMMVAFQGNFSGIVITVGGIGGLVYLLRRGATTPTTPSAPTEVRRVDGRPIGAEPTDTNTNTGPSTSPVGGWAAGPDWHEQTEAWSRAGDPTRLAPEVPVAAEPAPRRHSRALGWITLGVLAVTMGVLAALAPSPGAFVAAALAVVGVGLLIGTWFGRSRWLIGVGVALALALVPATFADHFGVGIGEVTIRPTTITELEARTETYHGIGTVTYDLTELSFSDADTVTVSVQHGIGTVEVFVNETVDVELNAQVGLGDADFGAEQSSGPGTNLTATDLGADGAGGGTVALDVQVGVGNVEVIR